MIICSFDNPKIKQLLLFEKKAHKTIKNKLNSKSFFLTKLMTPKPAETKDRNNNNLNSSSFSSSLREQPNPDLICIELAELLVTNAIMRAKHQLIEQEKTNSPPSNNKSIAFLSPQPNLISNDHSSSSTGTTNLSVVASSSSYHSSPFLQLESTHNSEATSISLFKKNRRQQRAAMAAATNADTSIVGDFSSSSAKQSLSTTSLSPILDDLLVNNKTVVDTFAANMTRIDKDVLRCDRNYSYFMPKSNLDKLKNIIYTYKK